MGNTLLAPRVASLNALQYGAEGKNAKDERAELRAILSAYDMMVKGPNGNRLT